MPTTQPTLVNYQDHPRKDVFRRLWAKPLIQYLNNKLGHKLMYMGLPGIEALDIKEWIASLDSVLAYQCLDDEKDYEVAEAEFDSLAEYLNSCTVKGTLRDYNLYKGYLEQVVMSGMDEDGNEFNQNDVVTVYNLDFCNTLSKPYPVVYSNGSRKDCYKIDAIDRLVYHQAQNALNGSNKFLMFVTVNASFLESQYDDINVRAFKQYKSRINGLSQVNKESRLIKAYTYYHLNNIFNKYGFQAEFLPVLFYEGTGGYRQRGTNQYKPTMMLTFTILGTRRDNPVDPVLFQDRSAFLNCKFLFANNNALSCHTIRSLTETDFNPAPTELLQQTITINTLW